MRVGEIRLTHCMLWGSVAVSSLPGVPANSVHVLSYASSPDRRQQISLMKEGLSMQLLSWGVLVGPGMACSWPYPRPLWRLERATLCRPMRSFREA